MLKSPSNRVRRKRMMPRSDTRALLPEHPGSLCWKQALAEGCFPAGFGLRHLWLPARALSMAVNTPREEVGKGPAAALSLLAGKGWFLLSLGPLRGVWPWVSAAAGAMELQPDSALQPACNQ